MEGESPDVDGVWRFAVWVPPMEKVCFDEDGLGCMPEEGDVLKLQFNVSRRLPGYTPRRPTYVRVDAVFERPRGSTGMLEVSPLGAVDADSLRALYVHLSRLNH